jgi:hypothetical protein
MLPDIRLEPRHNRLSSTDPGCYLSLGKSSFSSSLQDLVQELELLSERIIFAAHVGACQRPGLESFKSIPHLSPLSCAFGLREMLNQLKVLANKKDIAYQSLITVYLPQKIAEERKAD